MRELRQNLSVYLRRVSSGEALAVTEHGRRVALLAPIPALDDDPLADLVALGRVSPERGTLADLPPPLPPAPGRPSLSEVLQQMRDEDVR